MTEQQERNTFIFYRSFIEAIEDLPEDQQLPLFKAITYYSLDNKEPSFDGLARTIWRLIKPVLEANRTRYENGKKGGKHGSKGGRPKKEITPKKPQENPIGDILETPNLTPYKDKDNNKDKNKDEDKPSKKPKGFIPPTLQEVKDYCFERKNNVSPEKFFDYYSAGNWKDGKGNQVKNWKQKLLTWEKQEDKPQENNLCKEINTIAGSELLTKIEKAGNKAAFHFMYEADYKEFISLPESTRNKIKEKISKTLGTEGYEFIY